LRAQLSTNPGILGLAQIPLLSALICLALSEAPADAPPTLPDTRSGLIAHCLDVLLARWARVRRAGYDPEEAPGELVQRRAQRDLLAELARELTVGNPEHTLFSEVEVASAFARASGGAAGNPFGPDGQAAIDALARRVGILTRSGRPPEARYLFLHRTFQEYLLAWSVARRGDGRDILARHLYDPAWGEPIAMLGGAWSQLAREQGPAQDIAAEARGCFEWLLHENKGDRLPAAPSGGPATSRPSAQVSCPLRWLVDWSKDSWVAPLDNGFTRRLAIIATPQTVSAGMGWQPWSPSSTPSATRARTSAAERRGRRAPWAGPTTPSSNRSSTPSATRASSSASARRGRRAPWAGPTTPSSNRSSTPSATRASSSAAARRRRRAP
jgi:hypothetical protein